MRGKRKETPKYEFSPSFHVTFSANHWLNTEKTMEYFEHVIFPYFERQRKAKGYPTDQVSLVIMDCFKGQDNDTIKLECKKNYCATSIVPHNLTQYFQPLDVSVSKPAKSFVSNQ